MSRISFCVFVGAMAVANSSFAQKAIMMGQVINEQGKPAVGAEVKVTGHKVYYKMKTDNDGLYHTPMIDAASYHVIIDADGKYYTTDKIKVSKPGEVKEYYNFTLSGNDANLHIEDDKNKDPFMMARLEKIEADMRNEYDLNNPPKDKFTDAPRMMVVDSTVIHTEKKEESTRPVKDNTSVKIFPGEKVPQGK
jgi:hypothetical protein